MATTWYDLNVRGRRLQRITKLMDTKMNKAFEAGEVELGLAYLDRLIKLEHVTAPYVEQMTGMKRLLAQARENLESKPILERPPRL